MPLDNQGRASRVLPFPLKEQLVIVSPTSEGTVIHQTPNFFPVDSDERIDIILNMSLNEFVGVASALDIGRDIGYGDNSNEIWWVWVRSQRGAMTCEQIIDCIENDAATQAALTQYLNGAGNVNPNSVDADNTTVPQRFAGSAQALQDEIGTLADCNLDVLWGAIRSGIVHYLDDNARNFLEDLNAQADKGQRAANLLGAIPIVGDLASAVTLQFVELVPDLLNLFNSFSSETAMDNIACDIFEMVCAECRFPTWDELFSYYASAGISGIDDVQNLVFTAATDYLLGSSQLAALACYYTIITYELFVLYLGAKFNGAQGTASIALWAGLGEDFASDNWIALCDGCEPSFPTPYILLANCWDGTACGTNLTNISGNRWSVTVTHRTSPVNDYAFGIGAVGDVPFRLQNISFPGLTNPFAAAWQLENNTCNAGFYGASPNPATTTLKQLVYTWAIDGQYMEFDIVNPP